MYTIIISNLSENPNVTTISGVSVVTSSYLIINHQSSCLYPGGSSADVEEVSDVSLGAEAAVSDVLLGAEAATKFP